MSLNGASLDHISKFREGSSMEVGGGEVAVVLLLLSYINESHWPHWDLLEMIRNITLLDMNIFSNVVSLHCLLVIFSRGFRKHGVV